MLPTLIVLYCDISDTCLQIFKPTHLLSPFSDKFSIDLTIDCFLSDQPLQLVSPTNISYKIVDKLTQTETAKFLYLAKLWLT